MPERKEVLSYRGLKVGDMVDVTPHVGFDMGVTTRRTIKHIFVDTWNYEQAKRLGVPLVESLFVFQDGYRCSPDMGDYTIRLVHNRQV